MTLFEAIELDRAGDLPAAASAYEACLIEGRELPEAMANLMALYFQSTDYGVWSGSGLDLAFVRHAGERLGQLIQDAEQDELRWSEVGFWARYIKWADWGEVFSIEECREFMRRDPANIEPAFHLYALTGEREADALRLLHPKGGLPTVRASYVSAVVQSAMDVRKGRGVRPDVPVKEQK